MVDHLLCPDTLRLRHELEKPFVDTRVVGQLRVEGAGEDAVGADRHRVFPVLGQHLDAGTVPLDPGGADEHRPQRLVADPLDRKIGLEAL